MASIWKQNRDVTNDVKRNNFDLSFSNHSTFKFGYLYPVFCKRVYPTDSFRIDSAFDLKMMPLVFPVQSRIRANLHFFYVRNKNLWKNWEDWISGLKSNDAHPHPYIAPDDSKVQTGSIHDFLSVPTTVVTNGAVNRYFDTLNLDPYDNKVKPVYYRQLDDSHREYSFRPTNMTYQVSFMIVDKPISSNIIHLPQQANFSSYISNLDHSSTTIFYLDAENSQFIKIPETSIELRFDSVSRSIVYTSNGSAQDFITLINSRLSIHDKILVFMGLSSNLDSPTFEPFTYDHTLMPYTNFVPSTGVVDYDDLNLDYFKDVQPLNALAYRAYQSIYYGYYANDVLQPLMIDGEKEFNKFIENDGDGLDTTDYHLYKRNYELDFLTSALPSPQAGPAPLVGVSALGGVTITDANGVSTGQAVLDSDGNITKIVATSPIASVDHARTMMNIAALGFNINDLRSANALQRLAEQTLRSGYRYINWVKGQYGRSPEYRELDMAEFIGGFSRDVTISSVISQADTLGAGDVGKALGDYGANGRIIGGSNHSITHYCDDYGWIIGIMSVTPTPAYSQLLPKQMLAPNSPLDYANPFMNQIGMQPITYREVCPIQAYIDSLVDPDKSVDDVFGYQRPNYDEVGSVDEVHGEFRRTMKDFLINRQFDGRPELGKDFIEINPAEINDIFANQNSDDDVFIGHLGFKVTPKRPFPRVHVPGLGR